MLKEPHRDLHVVIAPDDVGRCHTTTCLGPPPNPARRPPPPVDPTGWINLRRDLLDWTLLPKPVWSGSSEVSRCSRRRRGGAVKLLSSPTGSRPSGHLGGHREVVQVSILIAGAPPTRWSRRACTCASPSFLPDFTRRDEENHSRDSLPRPPKSSPTAVIISTSLFSSSSKRIYNAVARCWLLEAPPSRQDMWLFPCPSN